MNAGSENDGNAKPTTHEPRSVARHLYRMDDITTARGRAALLRRRRVRGAEAQQPVRELEARFRRRALAMLVIGRRRGLRRATVARSLGLTPAMLARWQDEHDERCRRAEAAPSPAPAPASLGRPPLPEPPDLLRSMRNLCRLFGPALGAKDLHRDFPDASWRTCYAITYQCRGELRDQLRECRALACLWSTPGTVWAADLWKPEASLEGDFPCVLDVRDLATGFLVTSEPLEDASAASVGAAFDRLYRHFGAPLVCKTDNGGEFTGEGSWEVHHRYGVEQLLSPIYLPSYNGACEAGHGSMRYRTELLARRDGRPGDWSLNHLAGARDWANDHVDDQRPTSARQRFDNRPRVSNEERVAFRHAVHVNQQRRYDELRQCVNEKGRVIALSDSSITRPAIARALRDLGYLTHRSVPIRQPILHLKTGSVSL